MHYHRVDSGPNQSDGFSLATACASVALIFLTAMATMEIVCGGISGVPKDQLLAARALGFSFVQIVTTVVRPQAARIMKSSLVNQLVLVIKAPIELARALGHCPHSGLASQRLNLWQSKTRAGLVL